ncbi:hypothetical protein V1511DRAFT_335241 [Dipodascopsis uninucleata]
MAPSKQVVALDDRIATFRAYRVTNGSRRGGVIKAWPHVRPSVTKMARAGFVFDPSSDSPDNVTCFLCKKSMDGWNKADDPKQEHLDHSPDCAWALVNSDEWKLDLDHDPSSTEMQRARLKTFTDWWPHDGKRGWLPTSEAVSRAGFFYNPSREGDDLAACNYCGLVLDGWEPKDDPVEEHRRRGPTCFFFTREHDMKKFRALTKRQSTAANSRKRSSSNSAFDSEIEIEEPSSKRRSKSRSRPSSNASDPVVLPISGTASGRRTSTRLTASREITASSIPTDSIMEVDEEQQEIQKPKKRVRGGRPQRAKAKKESIGTATSYASSVSSASGTSVSTTSTTSTASTATASTVTTASEQHTALLEKVETNINIEPEDNSNTMGEITADHSKIEPDSSLTADDHSRIRVEREYLPSSPLIAGKSFILPSSDKRTVKPDDAPFLPLRSDIIVVSPNKHASDLSPRSPAMIAVDHTSPDTSRTRLFTSTMRENTPRRRVAGPRSANTPASARSQQSLAVTGSGRVTRLREKLLSEGTNNSPKTCSTEPQHQTEFKTIPNNLIMSDENDFKVMRPVSLNSPHRSMSAKRNTRKVLSLLDEEDAEMWNSLLNLKDHNTLTASDMNKTVEEWIMHNAWAGEQAMLRKFDKVMQVLQREDERAIQLLQSAIA